MAKKLNQIKHRPYLNKLSTFMECSPYVRLKDFPYEELSGDEILLCSESRGNRFVSHKVLTRYVKPEYVLNGEYLMTIICISDTEWYKIDVKKLHKLLVESQPLNKIKLYCANGLFFWEEGDNLKVRTISDVKDESNLYDTLIPKDTTLDVDFCDQSLYGTFMVVCYDGKSFWIKPKYVEVLC
ncbi:hypothetical protein [Vibrio phage JSF13]|jgi:hypothetical protein|uniref:Uncharacterized protein ORF177 n=1 Tax=Vibrio phage ICP1 TaxID=979525 RepID=F1D1K0_9CAUD|nr:hypothetical protein ViPhICP1_gp178 [Vibrio phage ICP1]ADX88220.1 hypothetical protein TUST1-191_00870 [Vibrio phage ICP1_2006_D]ADX88447.1 hypothetical protein TUST1-182_00870 [Vibrio phage ICP1_2006_C]ADX88671.1 hypothetical protein TUST1-159_00855 [Vibrio phage ICP1_2006_B]ADX88897.1 hypothetical protein TUST1-17_00855 [Vibrio phage ICP1_2006_A]ADX89127.1 hypothetical protein TUST1-15_00875 [Vibrio phage ICP1_2005_A]ADX89357.1 hypothetical protein TUST1-2_00885 [Vibrio phage ICP1_2001_A